MTAAYAWFCLLTDDVDTPPPGQRQAMATESRHTSAEVAVNRSPETTPTANIQAATEDQPLPALRCPLAMLVWITTLILMKSSAKSANRCTSHEVVAMKARCVRKLRTCAGALGGGVEWTAREKMNCSKSSAQRTLPKRSRDSYAKKEKWDHLTISLQCVLISCWPCGFLTSGSHQAKSMNQPLLSSYLSSVKNHMMEIGANVDNLKMTMKVLHAKRKGLKSQGKGTRPTWPVA